MVTLLTPCPVTTHSRSCTDAFRPKSERDTRNLLGKCLANMYIYIRRSMSFKGLFKSHSRRPNHKSSSMIFYALDDRHLAGGCYLTQTKQVRRHSNATCHDVYVKSNFQFHSRWQVIVFEICTEVKTQLIQNGKQLVSRLCNFISTSVF